LGASNDAITINYYLDYLKKCREFSSKKNIALREFDRALWQWSKENSKNSYANAK